MRRYRLRTLRSWVQCVCVRSQCEYFSVNGFSVYVSGLSVNISVNIFRYYQYQ
jgi:hypothetical protein